MRVLVLDAFPADSVDRVLVDAAVATLTDGGHDVTLRVLADGPFETFMSERERAAYHQDDPLVTADTREDASRVQQADALLFCYRTTLFTVPAVLKSWLERVLVPGVAFVFDDKERVRPGMTNIRRIGVITTTAHSARTTRRARDAGRRTILWTIRLNCHPLARRTFVSVPTGAAEVAKVRRALRRW